MLLAPVSKKTNASPLKMLIGHLERHLWHEAGSSTACPAAGCIVRPAEWRERSEKFGCHSEVIKRTPQFPSCSVVSSMGGPDYCNWAQQLTAREFKVKRNSSISIFQDVLLLALQLSMEVYKCKINQRPWVLGPYSNLLQQQVTGQFSICPC